MDLTINRDQWNDFINKFNRRNLSRPTKLEICDEMGVATEVKLLPFIGIDLEMKGKNSPKINIILGDGKEEGKHFSHNVENVSKIILKEGDNGQDEVLDIESENSERTLLFFESLLEIERD